MFQLSMDYYLHVGDFVNGFSFAIVIVGEENDKSYQWAAYGEDDGNPQLVYKLIKRNNKQKEQTWSCMPDMTRFVWEQTPSAVHSSHALTLKYWF